MGPNDDIAPILDLKYGTLSQQPRGAVPAINPPGLTRGAATAAGDFAVSPFAGMNAGEKRVFQSFNANQVGDPAKGGVTVISGIPSAAGRFSGLLNQGLKADEASRALAAISAGDLDVTKTRLLPSQVEADNALTTAQTGLAGAQSRLTGVQADVLPADSASMNALRKAQGALAYGSSSAEYARGRNLDQQAKNLSWYNPYAALGAQGMPEPESSQGIVRSGLRSYGRGGSGY